MARPRGLFRAKREICWLWIKRLSKDRTYCYATNKWLAEKIGVSERQISRYIKSLEDDGLLFRQSQVYYKEGFKTERHVYRTIDYPGWRPAFVRGKPIKKTRFKDSPPVTTVAKPHVGVRLLEVKLKPTPPRLPEPSSEAKLRAMAELQKLGIQVGESAEEKLKRENPQAFRELVARKLYAQHLRTEKAKTLEYSVDVQRALDRIPKGDK